MSDKTTYVEENTEENIEQPIVQKTEAVLDEEHMEEIPALEEPTNEAPVTIAKDPEPEIDKNPPKRSIRSLFQRTDKEKPFSKEEWILTRIPDEDLMQYLMMEQKQMEITHQIKEARGKRIFSAFQITVSLAAVAWVVYFLKDNPTVLVNILYIIGIIIGFWIWKNPRDK